MMTWQSGCWSAAGPGGEGNSWGQSDGLAAAAGPAAADTTSRSHAWAAAARASAACGAPRSRTRLTAARPAARQQRAYRLFRRCRVYMMSRVGRWSVSERKAPEGHRNEQRGWRGAQPPVESDFIVTNRYWLLKDVFLRLFFCWIIELKSMQLSAQIPTF